MGCAGANILLEDPGNELQVECNGMMSCINTNLEIIITPNTQVYELGTIEFNGQQTAQGMTITIINQGANPVMLQNLECMNPEACPNLRINIQGNVFIENCDLQYMNIQTAGPSLLAACQAGNNFQSGGGNNLFPPFQQPQPPLTNPGPFVPPQPQPPVNNPGPVTVPQPQPPVTQPQPQPPVTQPQPPVNSVNPGLGFPMFIDPQQLNCEFGQCRNREITLSPSSNFQLKCQQPGQCDGLILNLNVGYGAQIDSLTFSAYTNGATININGIYGQNIEINDIRCEVFNACLNLKINAGFGVEIYNINMDCQQPGSCTGCTINGMDCNMLSLQQGNNNAGHIGFGYPYYQNNPYYPYQHVQPQLI